MTRINLVCPRFLTDEHLRAELRELPRILSSFYRSLYSKSVDGDIETLLKKIPKQFCLNTGHVTFFYDKFTFLYKRWEELYKENIKRGFKYSYLFEPHDDLPSVIMKDFKPSKEDISISKERIKERITNDPNKYRYYSKTIFIADINLQKQWGIT